MTFKKIKRARIYEEVLAQLKDYLLKGNISPGNKLPSERELARMFGVNRVSVREALTILESNGMIIRKVGEGTFHADASSYTTSSIIGILNKNKNLIIEPLQVRRVLEPKIARLAAANSNKEQLERLNNILNQQKELLANKEDITDLDRLFHKELAISTGNPIFGSIVEALHNSFVESRYESPMSPERGKNGYLAHRKIYNALKNRDSDKAEDVMRDHIIQVEQSAIKYLKQKNKAL